MKTVVQRQLLAYLNMIVWTSRAVLLHELNRTVRLEDTLMSSERAIGGARGPRSQHTVLHQLQGRQELIL